MARIFQPKLLFNVKHNNALSSAIRGNVVLCQRTCATDQKGILSSPIPEFDGRPGINSYHDMYKFSLEHPDVFWGTLARSRLEWIKDFDRVQDCSFAEGKVSWFLNGKINVSGKSSFINVPTEIAEMKLKGVTGLALCENIYGLDIVM